MYVEKLQGSKLALFQAAMIHTTLTLLALVALITQTVNAADDIVEFGAGSRLTGEIKYLQRGRLYFKTDSTDTISLEWADVTALTTSQRIRIMDRDGNYTLGFLVASPSAGSLFIVSDDRRLEVPLLHVVDIRPLEETAWERLDVDVAAGYAFTKSTEVEQWNLSIDIDYSDPTRERSLAMTAQSSGSPENEDNFQGGVTYQTLRVRPERWGSGWGAGIERNDALSLDYRASAAWILGRSFYPRADQLYGFALGLQVNNEQFDNGDTTNSLEGYAGARFEWFRFEEPELDLSTRLTLFPSLTESGRLRGAFNIALTWEIYEDFYWQLSFYDNYDNQARDQVSDDNANTNDYGILTSIGWSK